MIVSGSSRSWTALAAICAPWPLRLANSSRRYCCATRVASPAVAFSRNTRRVLASFSVGTARNKRKTSRASLLFARLVCCRSASLCSFATRSAAGPATETSNRRASPVSPRSRPTSASNQRRRLRGRAPSGPRDHRGCQALLRASPVQRAVPARANRSSPARMVRHRSGRPFSRCRPLPFVESRPSSEPRRAWVRWRELCRYDR